MRSLQKGFIFLSACFFLIACKEVSFEKTKGGVPYKIFEAGKSKDSIGMGHIVKFHMIERVKGNGKIKDTILTSTYDKMPVYRRIVAGSGRYDDPLMDIIMKAKKGDSIYMVQAMDSFIVHQPEIVTRTPFRKGDQLITTVKIIDVFKTPDETQVDYEKMMKDDEANAPKRLDKYLADKKIKTEKTALGTYIETLSPGQGPKPDTGQWVTIQYKGTTLSGRPVDEGIYPLQLGRQGAIAGFEDAAKNMQKGQKARVYIPSALAYGSMGSSPDPRGGPPRVGPNENLIFEMTILEISNTAPPQQAPPGQPTDPGQN
ncbi:MAG: FKBP-type peptidyl-prolyl cis-trans isomerase [Flavisolibacter sp.]